MHLVQRERRPDDGETRTHARARAAGRLRRCRATRRRRADACPAVAAFALKWVAMASAMVTKLPLNMLTPDTCFTMPDLKTLGMRAIRQRTAHI